MKKIYIIALGTLCFSACEKPKVYSPANGMNAPVANDMEQSKEKNKNRNQQEREFIKNWIKEKAEQTFYPTAMNYWSSIDFKGRKASNEALYSYEYSLSDFNATAIYPSPAVVQKEFSPIKIEELKAVEDALKYLKPNEETVLLVPSSLAYGILGDGDKIPADLPLIIRLKRN